MDIINSSNKTIELINEKQEKLENHLETVHAIIIEKFTFMSEYISFHGIIHPSILNSQNNVNFINGIDKSRNRGQMFSKFNALHNSIISSQELQY